MKTLSIIITIVLFLAFFAMFYRVVFGGWAKAWCHALHGGCDWRWRYNERRPIEASAVRYTRDRGRWVGIYRCERCADESIGCARWEHLPRIVPPPAFDERQSA